MKLETIKANREFRNIYSRAGSAASKTIVLYCRKKRRGGLRCGITVSAKLGIAVKRNRVRRRIREIIRLNSFRLADNTDIVVVVRGFGIEAPYRTLETDFLSLAERLGILVK